jgi:RNA polymerase sigma-70 factor, ECF subfamily
VIRSCASGQYDPMAETTAAIAASTDERSTEALGRPSPSPEPHTSQVVPPLHTVDSQRMRAVVDAHFDFIWRVLRRLGVPQAGVDDATQRVFVVAAAKIGPVPPQGERSFLFAVALRVASEERRARKRRPEDAVGEHCADIVDPSPSPEELVDRTRARAIVDSVLEDLPFDLRIVFVLFEMEEMSTREIARLLELPAGTVASRLRRSRELFQAAVQRLKARRIGPRAGTP